MPRKNSSKKKRRKQAKKAKCEICITKGQTIFARTGSVCVCVCWLQMQMYNTCITRTGCARTKTMTHAAIVKKLKKEKKRKQAAPKSMQWYLQEAACLCLQAAIIDMQAGA